MWGRTTGVLLSDFSFLGVAVDLFVATSIEHKRVKIVNKMRWNSFFANPVVQVYDILFHGSVTMRTHRRFACLESCCGNHV